MRAVNAAGGQLGVEVSSAAGDDLLAQLFADLVRDMPALGDEPRWPDLERAYEFAKVRAGLEFQMDVLRYVRTNVTHLNQMRRPELIRSPIGISAVIKFAAAAGMPIVDLLKGGARRRRFRGEPGLYQTCASTLRVLQRSGSILGGVDEHQSLHIAETGIESRRFEYHDATASGTRHDLQELHGKKLIPFTEAVP